MSFDSSGRRRVWRNKWYSMLVLAACAGDDERPPYATDLTTAVQVSPNQPRSGASGSDTPERNDIDATSNLDATGGSGGSAASLGAGGTGGLGGDLDIGLGDGGVLAIDAGVLAIDEGLGGSPGVDGTGGNAGIGGAAGSGA